jgi:hypothetical protein
LEELPASIGHLHQLDELTLNGCDALMSIPESIGELSSLATLQLRCCNRVDQLPSSVGRLLGLRVLDLAYCSGLRRLPASVGQLTNLKNASIQECRGLLGAPPLLISADNLGTLTAVQRHRLPLSAPWDDYKVWFARLVGWLKRKEWTPAELLHWVAFQAVTDDQRLAIHKLVREQGTMLTTLERLSWLVVLLATTTFMAYMQPPGSFDDHTHQVMATQELLCSLRLPGRRGTGDYEQEQEEFRRCAATAFFVLDGLSFSLR